MTTARSGCLLQEWPFAYVVTSEAASNCCSFCLKRCDTPLQRCSQCHFAHFCNVACQRAAWADHKEECACLARVSPRVPTNSARLVARIFHKNRGELAGHGSHNQNSHINKDISNDATLSVSAFAEKIDRNFADLLNHRSFIENDPARFEHLRCLTQVLREYLGETNLPTTDELMDYFGKVTVNAINITNDDLNIVGLGLYIGLSALDHSCKPDAFILFDGPKALLRPFVNDLKFPVDTNGQSKPIDEITISYCDLMATSKERQDVLKHQFYFICNCEVCLDKKRDAHMRSLRCPVCSGEVPLFENTSQNIENDTSQESSCTNINSGSSNINICVQCDQRLLNTDEAVCLLQEIQWRLEDFALPEVAERKKVDIMSLLNGGRQLVDRAGRLLSDVNIFAARLFDVFSDFCISLDRTEEAAQICAKTMTCYSRFYPKGHPAISLQMLKLAKMTAYGATSREEMQNAVRLFEQATTALRLSHGEQHRLTGRSERYMTEMGQQAKHILLK